MKICKAAGLKFYNECILIETVGTAAIRAGRQFEAKRKVVKTHQNILIFLKGDEKEVVGRLNTYDYSLEDEEKEDI